MANLPEYMAKQLLKQFGFPIHHAPGEAEAECALLQREGIVDAVLSEDVDTLMFGSGVTLRNWTPEQKSNKTPTHVNVYDAVETKNGPSGLDREGLVLVALMSGGDYDEKGIPNCGPKTACEAARAGFGKELCQLAKNDTEGLQKWRERLLHEIKTNESKFFSQKRPSMKFPDEWPKTSIISWYAHPVISNQAGLDKMKNSIKWDQHLDFPGLRNFTIDAFDWAKLEGAKHFIRSLAPSLLVRHLRMRGEQIERLPTSDLQAIQEDEGLVVNGIHGKRQHAVTDSSTELRVSYTPIELVKIDLSIEEPDDEEESPLDTGADLDEDVMLDIEDDGEGSKKRGPTKFDPSKSYRTWVLEIYVKVGIPLKVQDWEAERQKPLKPKRTVSANDASTKTSKPRATRRTKTTDNAPQMSIQSFAKVTKPGVRPSVLRSKMAATEVIRPTAKTKEAVISLLSSSPIGEKSTVASEIIREKSLSPGSESSSSVTKRRRGPMQRARTLPSDMTTALDQTGSLLMDPIETLDLVDPPTIPSPSRAPVKKARTQVAKQSAPARAVRAASIAAAPGKNRQTTLDMWKSPGNSPSKPRTRAPVIGTTPILPTPRFEVSKGRIETLDLTMSSPLGPSLPLSSVTIEGSKRITTSASSECAPPTALSSNASGAPSTSSAFVADETTKSRTTIAPTSRRLSPRLRRTMPGSPGIESLDLTQLSSPPPSTLSPVILTDSSVARRRTKSTSTDEERVNMTNDSPSPPVASPALTSSLKEPDTSLRRSPRAHKSSSPPDLTTRNGSPPAAWKTQAKKKREVVLRKSLAGAWTFVDVESPTKDSTVDSRVLSGKNRRRWRESEIEVLDLS